MQLDITKKFTLLFLAFGLIPMLIVGLMAYTATNSAEEKMLSQFEGVAHNLADKIDRNLFERYHDVQAFTLNQTTHNRSEWYQESPSNSIVNTLDQYVDLYNTYYLTILVDLNGKVIAVNSKDANGISIDTAFIYRQNFSQTPWFRACRTGQFTTRQPFTAPGNDTTTGTFIEDLHIDSDVKRAYPNSDGLTLGFSAPVYEAGKIIAYWSNRTRFTSVENIFKATYGEIKKHHMEKTELTLLDKSGRILIDYDPTRTGSEEILHDLSGTLFKINLAERGVKAAQEAVNGKSGSLYATHSRKQIVQASGYAHLRGALGYPGMNWSVLARAPRAQTAASIIALRRNILITSVICVGIIIAVGFIIGRNFSKPLVKMAHVASLITEGDLTQRIRYRASDEVGQLGTALDHMADDLKNVLQNVSESANNLNVASTDLSATAEQVAGSVSSMSLKTSSVASAAEQMSNNMASVSAVSEQSATNLNTVASGSEEMTATIGEIAQNAEKGRQVTTKAVENVSQASKSVDSLNQAANDIGKIIDVILEIAEQTKLLALNATIEAARAGEAGKGFAVVASEVKDLAQQTNDAIEEIRSSVEAIQQSTDGTVFQMEQISNVINDVNDIVTSIATAVEEQSATTQDIAQNVSQAALGIDDMTQNVTEAAAASSAIAKDIAQIDQSSQDVEVAVDQIKKRSTDLSTLGKQLHEIVRQFKL